MNFKSFIITIIVCVSTLTIRHAFSMNTQPSRQEQEFNLQVQLLRDACRNGNKQMVEMLIDKLKAKNALNKALNGVVEDHHRPLELACIGGHAEIVEILLKNGASTKSRKSNEGTPIDYACRYNHLTVIKILVKHILTIDEKISYKKEFEHILKSVINNIEEIALFANACLNNNHSEACKIVETIQKENRLSDFVKEQYPEGDTPFTLAAKMDYADLVLLFIKNGADINAKNIKHQTALHIAVGNNSLKVAEILIKHSANLEAVDAEGDTPLMKACDKNLPDMVKLLVTNKANLECVCTVTKQIHGVQVRINTTPLFLCVGVNYIDIALYLINNGANINYADPEDKFSILHLACKRGNLKVIKALVSKNVDVNVETIHGVTPLDMLETSQNKKDIVAIKMLLKQQGIQGITAEEADKNMRNFIAELEQAQADKKEAIYKTQQEAEKKKEKNRKKKQRQKAKKLQSQTDPSSPEAEKNDVAGAQFNTVSNTLDSTAPVITTTTNTTTTTTTTSTLPTTTTTMSTASLQPATTTITPKSITASAPQQASPKPQTTTSTTLYQILIDKKNFTWPNSLKGNQKNNMRDHLLQLRNWPNHGCDVKSMKGKANTYRLRVGGYRAIFHVDDLNKQIRVLSLNLRKIAYRGFDF